MTPNESYARKLYENNVAIYGKDAARFIQNTALNYARIQVIIAGCELSPKGMAAGKQAGELASDNSAILAELLFIQPEDLLSYLELGKKTALTLMEHLKENE